MIDNRYMLALPNIGRNPLSLLNLTPGVVGAAGTTSPSNTNFVANGTRNSTSDVLVDGAIVNTTEQNSGATDLKWTPSVDAVQEFKMQTNFFSAEYAQSGGAVINMVTKSGTNEFHGDGYYFLRDSTFNANSWSANRAGSAIPYYHRDQFGAVIGGPDPQEQDVLLRAPTNTRTRRARPARRRPFPTLDQRNGDFSQDLLQRRPADHDLQSVRHFKDASGIIEAQSLPGQHHPQER